MSYIPPPFPEFTELRGDWPLKGEMRICVAFAERFFGVKSDLPNLAAPFDTNYRKMQPTFQNNAAWVQDEVFGPSVKIPNIVGSTNLIRLTQDTNVYALRSLTEQTFMIYFRLLPNVSSHYGIFGNWESSYGTQPKSVTLRCSENRGLYFYWGGTSSTERVGASNVLGNGAHLVICNVGPRGMEMWLDGVKIASNSNTPTLTAGGADLTLGDGWWGSKAVGFPPSAGDTTNCPCVIKFFCNFTRQLETAEIQALFDDPWQMLEDNRIYKPYFIPALEEEVEPPAVTITLQPAEAEFQAPALTLLDQISMTLAPAEAEFQNPNITLIADETFTLDPAVASFEALALGLALPISLTLTPAEAAFEAPNPSVAASDSLTISPAVSAFVSPALSLLAPVDLTLAVASAEFQAPNLDLLIEDSLTLTPAEAEFVIPDISLLIDDSLTLSPAEAEFQAPALDLAAVDALTLDPAIAQFQAPNLTLIAVTDIIATLLPAQAEFQAPAIGLFSDDIITLDPAEAVFDAPAVGIQDEVTFTLDPAVAMLVAPALELDAEIPGVMRLTPAEMTLQALAIQIVTEDNVYYSQKQRIHNALVDAVLAGVFLPITYDPNTFQMSVGDEDSERITPKTILANDEACTFGDAEINRRSQIFERGVWSWTLKIVFAQNALFEHFEKSFLANPIILERDEENGLEQVTLLMKKAEYAHPIQQQGSVGSEGTYSIVADFSPK